jgi:hypothetical protein
MRTILTGTLMLACFFFLALEGRPGDPWEPEFIAKSIGVLCGLGAVFSSRRSSP